MHHLGRVWRGLPADVLELVLDFDGRRFHRRGGVYRLDPEDPRFGMVDRVPRPTFVYYGLREWYNIYEVRFRNRAFELTKTCMDLDLRALHALLEVRAAPGLQVRRRPRGGLGRDADPRTPLKAQTSCCSSREAVRQRGSSAPRGVGKTCMSLWIAGRLRAQTGLVGVPTVR